MEPAPISKTSHKEWRRLVKRERRRRLRQKTARVRDADAERLRAALESSAGYLTWLTLERKKELELEEQEEKEHKERERMWLEEEVRAQKEWRIHQERKAKTRQEQLEQDKRIRQEYEAKQEILRLKKEEDKRKQEEELRKQQELQQQIDDYIDKGTKTPEPLRMVTTSQPGKDPCPFFTKTGACRYGDTCSRNHQRVALSKVILIPGFYSHFSLEKNSAEYDTDVYLEFENSETRQHFTEFYKDVVPELESFGRIKTLKYCFNTEIHLRGNLYVEYYTERDAARALRKLKGRWYAGRQLNCEFTNIKSWRNAVCGMIKCPKGRACNFLHTFRNPNDEYDIKSPPRWSSKEGASSRRSDHRSTRSTWEDSVRSGHGGNGTWRWSESPEPEQEEERSRRNSSRQSSRNGRRRRSGNDRRYEDVDKGEGHRYAASSSRKHGSRPRKSRRLSEGEGKGGDDYVESSRKSGNKQEKRLNRTAEDFKESGASCSRRSQLSHHREDGRKQDRDNRRSMDRYHSSKHDHDRTKSYGRTLEKRKANGRSDRRHEHHDEVMETSGSTSANSKVIVKGAETMEENVGKTYSKVEEAKKVEGLKSKWDDSDLSVSGSESDMSFEMVIHSEDTRKKKSENQSHERTSGKIKIDEYSNRKHGFKHHGEELEASDCASTSSKMFFKGDAMAKDKFEKIDSKKVQEPKRGDSEFSVTDSESDVSEDERSNRRSIDRHHSLKHNYDTTKSCMRRIVKKKTYRKHETKYHDAVVETSTSTSTSSKTLVKIAETVKKNAEKINPLKVVGPKSKWDDSELSDSETRSDTSEGGRKQERNKRKRTDKLHNMKDGYDRTKSSERTSSDKNTDEHSDRKHQSKYHDELMETTVDTSASSKMIFKSADAAQKNVENFGSSTKVQGPKSKWDDSERVVSGSGSDTSSENSESSKSEDKEVTATVEKRRRVTKDLSDGWDTTDSESDKKIKTKR